MQYLSALRYGNQAVPVRQEAFHSTLCCAAAASLRMAVDDSDRCLARDPIQNGPEPLVPLRLPRMIVGQQALAIEHDGMGHARVGFRRGDIILPRARPCVIDIPPPSLTWHCLLTFPNRLDGWL